MLAHGMAPILMNGLAGDINSPRPTAQTPPVRLSELEETGRQNLLIKTAGDLPHYARSTLSKAELSSQEQCAQSRADTRTANAATAAARAKLPPPPQLPRNSEPDTFQIRQQHPRPKRMVPPAPPPIPTTPMLYGRVAAKPPFWASRPRAADSGRERGLHDGLESPATFYPVVQRVQRPPG